MVMNLPKKLWILQVSWLKNMPEGLKKDAKSVDKFQMKVSVIDASFRRLRYIKT